MKIIGEEKNIKKEKSFFDVMTPIEVRILNDLKEYTTKQEEFNKILIEKLDKIEKDIEEIKRGN